MLSYCQCVINLDFKRGGMQKNDLAIFSHLGFNKSLKINFQNNIEYFSISYIFIAYYLTR